MVPVFVGGLLRLFTERGAKSAADKAERREHGALFGSGLVGGEGLCGVAIAGVVFYLAAAGKTPPGGKPMLPLTEWAGTHLPEIVGFALFAWLVYYFLRVAAQPRR